MAEYDLRFGDDVLAVFKNCGGWYPSHFDDDVIEKTKSRINIIDWVFENGHGKAQAERYNGVRACNLIADFRLVGASRIGASSQCRRPSRDVLIGG